MIDRLLGNLDWLRGNLDTILINMPHNVSSHALLCLQENMNNSIRRSNFKSINSIAYIKGYAGNVMAS